MGLVLMVLQILSCCFSIFMIMSISEMQPAIIRFSTGLDLRQVYFLGLFIASPRLGVFAKFE